MPAAVWQEAVGDADGGAVIHGVAVALVMVLVVERFGIGKVDLSAFAS